MLTKTAVDFFGGHGAKTRIAAAVGITTGAVSQWGDVVPEGQAYKLEKLTNGELKVDPACYLKPSASKPRDDEAA